MILRKTWYLFSKYFLKHLSNNLFFNILFFINCLRLGKKYYFLNIKKPRTFNEKINYLKLKNNNSDLSKFADKVLVRDIIKDKIGDKYLIPLIGVYNELDTKLLLKLILEYKNFIIKMNFGSGLNIIVHENSDLQIILENVTKWMNMEVFHESREFHYSQIDRKILIEQLISDNPNDYKFHCFGGKVQFIQVDLDRFIKHKRNIYNSEWVLQNFEINYSKELQNKIARPENLKQMIEIAEKIASINELPPYSRLDLYNVEGKVFFGEVTFYPGGGVEPFDCYYSDLFFGSFLKIQ